MLARVIQQTRMAPGIYRLELDAPDVARRASPGQFVHVRIGAQTDPLLRRPFSVHDVQGDNITILYRRAGRGTALLTRYRPGQLLDLLGPLGRGFSWNGGCRSAVLVAGGIGLAPLFFLARRLAERGCRIVLLVGGATATDLPEPSYFAPLATELYITTEDGSAGYKGLVTEQLDRLLAGGVLLDAFYACGPQPMLQSVAGLCSALGIKGQVSLEENMACGVGACLGCAVEVYDHRARQKVFRRVCRDGPVFAAEEVVWHV